jgi:hypothetical protein
VRPAQVQHLGLNNVIWSTFSNKGRKLVLGSRTAGPSDVSKQKWEIPSRLLAPISLREGRRKMVWTSVLPTLRITSSSAAGQSEACGIQSLTHVKPVIPGQSHRFYPAPLGTGMCSSGAKQLFVGEKKEH